MGWMFGPRCWWWFYPGSGFFGIGFFRVFLIIIAVVIIYLLVRRRSALPVWTGSSTYANLDNAESALDILKKRYARGEINQEEFERIKKEILN